MISNFSFYLPTKAYFGKGQIATLATAIPKTARILLTYGGGSIKKNGVFEQVQQALQAHFYIEFGGIEANPEYETIMKAVELVRKEKLDFILAVGGGSVLDGSKFIAVAVPFDGEPWDIPYKKAPISTALPIGCVLTLPATGSEMNHRAVVSRRATQDKVSLYSDLIRPQFAILDPTTTFSLPVRQTANGVVDAFVHTLEQYATYPVNGKIQDRFAEGVLLTLLEDGPKLLDNPMDYDARANVMWAATQGLNDILSVGVPGDWSSHAIGHELTAVYGLDHAQTLAIIVPALFTHQIENKRDKLTQMAQRVFNYQGDSSQAAEFAVQKTREFFEQMGLKTRFSDLGIDDSQFPLVLQKLAEHRPQAIGEHKNIDNYVAKQILYMAL
ncbi:NADH-dependent butanol dehydrogenase 1 [Actinobacillus porcinus]|uniref:NADH-dependent butanol dehydrogenase 1 n=1 Tax=Actinobacillus porcinus TaxID=51048 RepID=A0ABY6TLU3_9PAST|nr:iron-containing alcohol dehydrogenase [Actinobacillus porcinus]VFY93746.1 NADH-dependent butanol dehydrogenase 1 [Actinobacillus porcinus]VTU09055.1 NADH-dependent butanol dehydrogenase 1 [Actinobacillus porcinus]